MTYPHDLPPHGQYPTRQYMPPGRQQQWPPPQQAWPPPQPPRNGFGITALALSLIGLLFCLMPITGFIGLGLGLLGFLFAALGLSRVHKGLATNKGVSVAGLVLSVLAIVGGFIAMKMFFDLVDDLGGGSSSSAPPSAVSTAGDDVAPPATTQGGEFTAGQTADRDGLQITAGPLQKVKPQYGVPLLCSEVSYVNTSSEERRYNMFDWKLQDPNSNIVDTTYGGDTDLKSGALAGGGKVAGRVCFNDPKLKGNYAVINEEMFASSAAARWKTTI